MKLFLMRHLETEYSSNGKYCGQIDCPILPSINVDIPSEILSFLKENEIFYFSSPLKRAKLTLDKLKEHLIIKQFDYREELSERDYGIYNGMDKEEVHELINTNQEVDFINSPLLAPPNGESQNDLKKRVYRFMDEIRNKYQNVFLITHQGVLRAIYQWMNKDSFIKFSSGEIKMEEI